jgi:Asp-tRNA(Asn)/Glu-tRNA(Gln) amidotransferase A subunit family amidase
MFAEYDRLDGLALAEMVKTSQISSAELVAEMRARFEAKNPAINAVVRLFENELASPAPTQGAFAGLPMLVKDLNLYVEGQVTANGSRSMRSLVADRDSALVQRYRKAGLIIAGQTNSPEFGLSPTTEPLLNGPTHNPWKRGLSSGGSSGGASAAIAAGIVPFAHASDGGGSIRIPAAACGLFGLKPSRGRISPAPYLGEGWNGLSTSHVITRSVRDSAALLDISHGYELGDPYAAPHVRGSFLEASERIPRTLSVAFSTANPLGLPLDEDCVAAVLDAARLCESLGHVVEEASPDYEPAALSAASYGIIGPHIVATLREIEARLDRPVEADELEDITRMMRETSLAQSAADYVDAQRSMHRLTRELAAFWQGYDVYLTPTLGQPPQPHDTLLYRDGMDYLEYGTRMATYVPFTTLANVTGQPSMSVPLFWNGEEIPIGVMFTGAYGSEATLYGLAGQLETARPWFDRRPPASA